MADKLISKLSESTQLYDTDCLLKVQNTIETAEHITRLDYDHGSFSDDAVRISLLPNGSSWPYDPWSLTDVPVGATLNLPIGSSHLIPIDPIFIGEKSESESSISVNSTSGDIYLNDIGFYSITISINFSHTMSYQSSACGMAGTSSLPTIPEQIFGTWFYMYQGMDTTDTIYRSFNSTFYCQNTTGDSIPIVFTYYGQTLKINNDIGFLPSWFGNRIDICKVRFK